LSPPDVKASESMTLVVHLSDLHMTQNAGTQAALFERLITTLSSERERARDDRVAVVITGDVFDSATDSAPVLVEAFLSLHRRLLEVLGKVFTVVLPGNHDRRRFGLIGPNREALFLALRHAADPAQIHVAGTHTPFLAEVVSPASHGLPVHVVAYDSSYLPGGLVGAGGTFRLEDLLQVHARLPNDGRPLLLLVHHHLIPTPITDVSHVDMVGTPRPVRWLVRHALPALVSNADREELTMTALGAGTALSALHSFGRAVLLLHGHKHVPTARLVRGLGLDCGDLILASAGSAGRAEGVNSSQPNPARLWPSLNLVRLTEDGVHIEAVSFSPKRRSRPAVRRDLVRARRAGRKWEPEPVELGAKEFTARLLRDEADYLLSVSETSRERWDFSCRRLVLAKPGAGLRGRTEFVHALPPIIPGAGPKRRAYRRVELSIDAEITHQATDALCRTLREAERRYGRGTAFEWAGLLCRHGAEAATLRLSVPAGESLQPFASFTDLQTGRERPWQLERRGDSWSMTVERCAPRSLLRIYWPLLSDDGAL
jgi:predicted MPP superfamily phosphohydrolase